jgi:putative DNA primase/helicase
MDDPRRRPPGSSLNNEDLAAFKNFHNKSKKSRGGKKPEPPPPQQDDPGASPIGQPPGLDQRPTITLRVGETERAVNEIESLLIASNRGLYQRGGLIASTGFTKMQTWDGETVVGQIIEERGEYALVEDAEALAKFIRLDADGKPRPAPAPMTLIRTLKDRKHRLRFPVLVGIVNCPSISVDGKLLDRPGYDPETGVLYDPLGVIFPPVPSAPDKRMASTALARILKLLATFDFVSDDDRAVALSLIFTAIARRGLPHAPLHGFDAPVAGSGKSMLVDIACILATGHEAGVIAQGENREEAEKRLSSTLMRGTPIIAMDNCELPLEGVLLNQSLTQQAVELRILGFSKMITAQAMAVHTATGNNLTIKGDLTRRSVVARLDPKVAQPELRDFAYDPIADAKANRGELVAAVLTVLMAYHIAGRPNRPSPPLQSFVPWSNTVRGALLWLGQGDPVKTMDRLRKNDPVLKNVTAVAHAWRDEFDNRAVTASEAVETAAAHIFVAAPGTEGSSYPLREKQFTHGNLREALLEVANKVGDPDARLLGNWLTRSAVDRVVDLGLPGEPERVAIIKAGEKQGTALWKLEKRS